MALITDFDAEAGDGTQQTLDITPRQTATTIELNVTDVRYWNSLTEDAARKKALRDSNKPFADPPVVLREYEFSEEGGYAYSKDISFSVSLENPITRSHILTRTITTTASVNRQYNVWYINKFSPVPGAVTFPCTVRISRGGSGGTSMLYAVRLLGGEQAASAGPATTAAEYVDVVLTEPSIVMAIAYKSGTGWGDGMIGIYTTE